MKYTNPYVLKAVIGEASYLIGSIYGRCAGVPSALGRSACTQLNKRLNGAFAKPVGDLIADAPASDLQATASVAKQTIREGAARGDALKVSIGEAVLAASMVTAETDEGVSDSTTRAIVGLVNATYFDPEHNDLVSDELAAAARGILDDQTKP